jgi:arylsulfatase A-like enzyme
MSAHTSRRPNFIVLYLDDLGFGDLGCQGSDVIKTPHIDSLAERGVRFSQWYSNSPVCSPSRAALLTGRHPMRAGVPHILGGKRGTPGLPSSERTMADILKAEGYRTGLIGKWHLGVSPETTPMACGFDEFFGFKAGCIDYYSHIFYWCMYSGVDAIHDLWENEEEVYANGQYFTTLIGEKSADFIDRHAEEEFLLYVGFNAPHYPMHAPQEYLDRYPDLPWDRQIMAAMVSAVDDEVGRIVAKLEEHGLTDDTVIFFSSDNGPSTETRNWLDGTEDKYYGGSAGIFRGHKGSLLDGGIREPGILCWPGGIEGGQVWDEVCATMDVLPTFLDIAGIDPGDGPALDGTSILDVARGQNTSPPHPELMWEYAGQLAIRRGPWKLVLHGKLDFGSGGVDDVHLSNLDDDPGERTNLAECHPEMVADMRSAVEAWYDEVCAEHQ